MTEKFTYMVTRSVILK